jgi:hypothetical protein
MNSFLLFVYSFTVFLVPTSIWDWIKCCHFSEQRLMDSASAQCSSGLASGIPFPKARAFPHYYSLSLAMPVHELRYFPQIGGECSNSRAVKRRRGDGVHTEAWCLLDAELRWYWIFEEVAPTLGSHQQIYVFFSPGIIFCKMGIVIHTLPLWSPSCSQLLQRNQG